jgi:arylsulfatase A-like enzyme
MLIFTSDNGGVSRLTSNEPLRAGKGTYYEGGIRTPMCVRWPGVVRPGSSTDIPVIGVDFMPTFAELSGTPLPADQPVDGVSIVPVFRGQAFDAYRAIFFHFPLYLGGGGVDQVLPTYNGESNYWRAVPLSVIMKGKWKLIYYYEYDSFELFNLENDISESHDLAIENKQKAEELVDELMQWVDRVDAPVPEVPND